MPLLQFYHPPGAFTDTETRTLATTLCTQIYTRLPSFYVNVHFIELLPSNHYIGGNPRSNFVRIVIEHLAHHIPVPTSKTGQLQTGFKDKFEKVIKPYVADKGFDWEFAVIHGEQHLWRINGVDPPSVGDGDLEVWKREGKAGPRRE